MDSHTDAAARLGVSVANAPVEAPDARHGASAASCLKPGMKDVCEVRAPWRAIRDET